MSHKIGVH